jgi:hypothetical protein
MEFDSTYIELVEKYNEDIKILGKPLKVDEKQLDRIIKLCSEILKKNSIIIEAQKQAGKSKIQLAPFIATEKNIKKTIAILEKLKRHMKTGKEDFSLREKIFLTASDLVGSSERELAKAVGITVATGIPSHIGTAAIVTSTTLPAGVAFSILVIKIILLLRLYTFLHYRYSGKSKMEENTKKLLKQYTILARQAKEELKRIAPNVAYD